MRPCVSTARLPSSIVPVHRLATLKGRDKPKDVYDICYCLDHYAGGIPELAAVWRHRKASDPDISRAVGFLREKFESVGSYGPMQIVEFHNDFDPVAREEQARRAFELVWQFLAKVESEDQA